MAYVAWSVVFGEQPTAAKWNILGANDASFNDGTGIANDAIINAHILTGNLYASKFYNPYKFSAYRNAAITPTGTAQITFDAEDFDTGNNYSTANGRFTAPIAGFYWFGAHFNTATPNRLLVYFYKNGSAFRRLGDAFNTTISTQNVSTIMQLAANDYVECYVNTASSALSVGSGSDSARFQGFLISAT